MFYCTVCRRSFNEIKDFEKHMKECYSIKLQQLNKSCDILLAKIQKLKTVGSIVELVWSKSKRTEKWTASVHKIYWSITFDKRDGFFKLRDNANIKLVFNKLNNAKLAASLITFG